MQIIRNPEIKNSIAAYLIFTGIVCSSALFIFNFWVMLYIGLVCLAAIVLFSLFTVKRYQDISDLSYEIDKILHAKENGYLTPNKEGELAILTNQIAKMTIRLQEQSEQLQKEKDILKSSIADISHQVRTPLTSVRMNIHRLMSDQLTFEQRNETICEINGMLSRIEWLITALLKIARLEAGVVEFEQREINVAELLKSALQPLEIMVELKEIKVDMRLQNDFTFCGDFSWSSEAVGNILKNCIEHLPPCGVLQIGADDTPLYTDIYITDNGTGICEEDIPHLFERFYKGKNSGFQNIGIGLALSRMIINKENGIIKVNNIKPHGTEFLIRFYKGAV